MVRTKILNSIPSWNKNIYFGPVFGFLFQRCLLVCSATFPGQSGTVKETPEYPFNIAIYKISNTTRCRFVVLLYVSLLEADALAGNSGASSLSRRARELLRQKMKTLSAGTASDVQYRGTGELYEHTCCGLTYILIQNVKSPLRVIKLFELKRTGGMRMACAKFNFNWIERCLRMLQIVPTN